MLNTLVSLKSYVGTIIIFVSFIICFVVLVATMSLPNVKFLTIPLTIMLGIALMNSVVYLNAIIKMKEEDVDVTNEQITLKSCPEYWVRDTMYKTNEDDTREPVTICKNYYDHPSKTSTTRYVGGSGNRNPESDSNSSFFNNFVSSYSNTGDTSPSNIDDLLATMNSNDFSEAFTNEPPDIYTSEMTFDNESNNMLLTTSQVTDNTQRVLYAGTSNFYQHSNQAISNVPGYHYHYISSMIRHNNDANFPEHARNNDGAAFHWHSQIDDQNTNTELPADCQSNWICKDATTNGLMINLDELNSYSNNTLCRHGREFHWVESANKCDVVNL